MYKATTYLTSIFSKFRVQDKGIRKLIVQLYGGLIAITLKDVPENKRIFVLKLLSLVIKDTIIYLNAQKKEGCSPDPKTLKVFRSLINFNKDIIVKIGLKSMRSVAADRILNEAFLSDIACDMGECVRDFKKSKSFRERIEIIQRLKVLVNDYNAVEQSDLTIRDVFDDSSNKHGDNLHV